MEHEKLVQTEVFKRNNEKQIKVDTGKMPFCFDFGNLIFSTMSRDDWCKEHCLGEFFIKNLYSKIYFELEEDKIAFILRWGGDPEGVVIGLTSTPVNAHSRKLKATWTMETQPDITAMSIGLDKDHGSI